MSRRGDREHLKDILISCENIIEYSKDCDFNMFMSDRKTQDAILRNIEIIGEAVKTYLKKSRINILRLDGRKLRKRETNSSILILVWIWMWYGI